MRQRTGKRRCEEKFTKQDSLRRETDTRQGAEECATKFHRRQGADAEATQLVLKFRKRYLWMNFSLFS